jgi:hypothetical protein
VFKRMGLAVSSIGLALSGTVIVTATTEPADGASIWRNCTAVHTRYPHGVGRVHAVDRVRSGRPVTNFKRSNRLYATAMNYNSDLDRDRDKVACEKH